MDIHEIHPDSFPFTQEVATELLRLIPVEGSCNLSECEEPAIRLGVFEIPSGECTLKFLCERHKLGYCA